MNTMLDADIQDLKEQLIKDPEVHDLIRRRSFELYMERGDQASNPAEDWLRAENEILSALIEQMVSRNQRIISTHDTADPAAVRAAEHMREELAAESATGAGPVKKAPKAKAARKEAAPKAKAAKKAPVKKAPARKLAEPKAATPKARKPRPKKAE
jgi:hypothetical protein